MSLLSRFFWLNFWFSNKQFFNRPEKVSIRIGDCTCAITEHSIVFLRFNYHTVVTEYLWINMRDIVLNNSAMGTEKPSWWNLWKHYLNIWQPCGRSITLWFKDKKCLEKTCLLVPKYNMVRRGYRYDAYGSKSWLLRSIGSLYENYIFDIC